jgi:hypothetical protein
MKDDSKYEVRQLRWTGVWRAMLLGSLVGLAGAAALERLAPPQTEETPVSGYVTLRSRGTVRMTFYPSRVSAWTIMPMVGAWIGLTQRLVRNSRRPS